MVMASESDEIYTSAQKVFSIEDLLIKILAGLPLASLRLFKSVCKRWLSLITDPNFNALRSRSPNADHPKGLLFQLQSASSVFVYVPFKLDPPLITTTPRFPYATNSRFMEVWQSCNGLLLCNDWPDKLYVYNPTINQCKLLPLPHVWIPNRFLKALAIAFDPTVSPHYKLVYAREDCTRLVHLEIYSSETGIWKACTQTFNLASFIAFDGRVVYWRGAIHWLSRLHVYHFSLDDAENPHFIHVEDHRALYGITYGVLDKFVVSRDCLLLVRILQPLPQVNVYEMKSDYYSGGWSVKYHVNLESVVGPVFHVLSVVLGEREEDSFLVLEVPRSMLLRYNIISNAFHQLCDLTQIQLRYTRFCSFFFTPSLVAV